MQPDPDYSPDEYLAAFRAADERLSPPNKEVLRAHYLADNHAASVGELMAALGYGSRQPVNKNLINLSKIVCDEIGAHLGDPVMILASVDQAPGTEPRLTLRPAVVQALKKLGWFDHKSVR